MTFRPFDQRCPAPGRGKTIKLRCVSLGAIVDHERVNDRAIFIHGFAKNEKSNLSTKELNAFKELAKILLGLSPEDLATAIENGNFIEVKS